MSHVTCVWVISIWNSHVTCVWVMSIWMSHVMFVWVMSIWMSHVMFVWVMSIWMSHVMFVWVMSIWISHVMFVWFMSIWMSHVMFVWVMSNMNESCHRYETSHVLRQWRNLKDSFTWDRPYEWLIHMGQTSFIWTWLTQSAGGAERHVMCVWVMSIWMSDLIEFKWVTSYLSHMNKSRHIFPIWTSHVT